MKLSERMKRYEQQETERTFMPLLPILARLDGKCFHWYTQGLERPYDPSLCRLMIDLSIRLVRETGALAGYTQSDEITLLFYGPDDNERVFFDGKIQKMTSLLAALCSVHFNALKQAYFTDPPHTDPLVIFDCRCWHVPNQTEAADVFLWREQDATNNSLSMAASHYYSHEELLHKNNSEKQEMLFQQGVNWNDYPAFFKRGTFVRRHQGSPSDIIVMNMPPFGRVINREAVLFDEATPLLKEKEKPLLTK